MLRAVRSEMERRAECSSTQLYAKRWGIVLIVFAGGCQVGFSSIDLGAWSDYISESFEVSHETVDLVVLTGIIGSLIAVVPVALVSLKYANHAKYLIASGFLIFGAAFLIQAIAIAEKLAFYVLAIGQLCTGIANAVFYASAPLVASSWFAEREQATFFGVVWFSIGAGKLLGSSLPSMIAGLPLPLNGSPLENGIQVTLWTLSAFDFIICALIVFFLPSLPPLPPSASESQRLAITLESANASWRRIASHFIAEVRVFFTDKITLALMFLFGTLISMTIVQFMMMPVTISSNALGLSAVQGNSTVMSHGIEFELRSRALMAISIGALLGAIPAGLFLDRLKKYNPMANIIGISILVSGILIFLAVQCSETPLLYIACGLYGFASFAANCFFTEIIKQYIYPTVFETNFGLILANSLNVLLLVYSPIMRQILQHYGSTGYYIAFCLILMGAEMIIICVKPDLKRFLYESEQSALLNTN